MINTLLQSHKPVTRAIYRKVWRRFNLCLTESGKEKTDFLTILEFLQEGIDKGLSLSMIKVQISALLVYLQHPLQQDFLISRFCKSVSSLRLVPCRKITTWDLSIMLKAVIRETFEPLSRASLRLITHVFSHCNDICS